MTESNTGDADEENDVGSPARMTDEESKDESIVVEGGYFARLRLAGLI